ncbi:DNA-binding protein [Carp edema virus]|nr:DNA-binding protein [Carp edema virus]
MDVYIKKILTLDPELEKVTLDVFEKFSKQPCKQINIKFDLPGLYCNDSFCSDPFIIPDKNFFFSTLDHDMIVLQNNDYAFLNVTKIFEFCMSNNIYIMDFYFRPIGWLLNKRRDVPEKQNLELVLIYDKSDSDQFVNNLIRKFSFLNAETQEESRVSTIGTVNAIPKFSIFTYWPFNPDYSIIILFFNTYIKGNKVKNILTKEFIFPSIFRQNVFNSLTKKCKNIYKIDDILDKMILKKINNPEEASPEVYSITNLGTRYTDFLMEEQIKNSFDSYSILNSNVSCSISLCYIKKRFVDITDLPDDVPIQCLTYDNTTYIIKINKKVINPVLILKKNLNFLKTLTFKGEFTKSNLVYKKRVTVKIESSDFLIPEFNPRITKSGITTDSKWKHFTKPCLVEPSFYF